MVVQDSFWQCQIRSGSTRFILASSILAVPDSFLQDPFWQSHVFRILLDRGRHLLARNETTSSSQHPSPDSFALPDLIINRGACELLPDPFLQCKIHSGSARFILARFILAVPDSFLPDSFLQCQIHSGNARSILAVPDSFLPDRFRQCRIHSGSARFILAVPDPF